MVSTRLGSVTSMPYSILSERPGFVRLADVTIAHSSKTYTFACNGPREYIVAPLSRRDSSASMSDAPLRKRANLKDVTPLMVSWASISVSTASRLMKGLEKSRRLED